MLFTCVYLTISRNRPLQFIPVNCWFREVLLWLCVCSFTQFQLVHLTPAQVWNKIAAVPLEIIWFIYPMIQQQWSICHLTVMLLNTNIILIHLLYSSIDVYVLHIPPILHYIIKTYIYNVVQLDWNLVTMW